MRLLERCIGMVAAATCMATMAMAQPGSLDPTFDPGSGFNSNSNTVLLQPDGKVIVGGDFTSFNGTLRSRIARLNTDGSLDATFDPGTGFNATVQCVALQPDGKIIVGGWFTSFNGTARGRIARLNSDGSLDGSFANGAGFDGSVRTVGILSSGKVAVGGQFTTYNGVSRCALAQLQASGALDASFVPGCDMSMVRSLVVQPDDKLVIGNAGVPWIRRYNTNGSADATFNSTGLDNTPIAMVRQPDGKLVLVGFFSAYGGTTANSIARLNADGSYDASFSTGSGFDNFTYAVGLQPDGKVLVGGLFSSYNGTPGNYLVRLHGNGSLDASFVADLDNAPMGLAVQADGKWILGGYFTTVDMMTRSFIARLESCNTLAWYADANVDGFGDPITSTTACTQPPGYVANNADCDDTDDQITGPLQWWQDNDGDGWGALFTLVLACDQPPGYVDNDIDCDDNDALNVPTVWYVDVDSDGYGDPNNMILACAPPLGATLNNTDCDDDDASLYPGAPCDDGNAGTTNDVVDGDCVCAGTPCTDVTFELITDANGGETSWQVLDANTSQVEMSGSGYASNSACIREPGCLPDGDHVLQVADAGTGSSGGYLLRQGNNGRIVHSGLGFAGTLAQHGSDGEFALPIGTDRLIDSRCDVNGLQVNDNVVAASHPDVAALVVPGNWTMQTTQAGYEFWIFDPDGGYSHTIYRSLHVNDGGGGGQDTRARTLFLNYTLNPIPQGVELNVRVRHRLPGGYISPYGPACRMLVNGNTSAYWPSHLVDIPGDANHSCGITAVFDPASTMNRIFCTSLTGGAYYKYEWTRVSGGGPLVVEVARESGSNANNRYMALTTMNSPSWMPNWPYTDPALQPQPGDVWAVRVKARRNGQGSYGPFGPCCLITIGSRMQGALTLEPGTEAGAALQLWPNPNNGGLLNIGMEGASGALHIELTDATGRLVLSRTLALAENGTATLDPGTSIAPGIYLANAAIGVQRFTERLVVER